MAGYVVTKPLALVKDTAGKVHYRYEGAAVPDDTPPAELQRLADRGLIGLVAEPRPVPVSTPPDEPPPNREGESGPAASRPLQTAPKSAWVDYAMQVAGLDLAEAEEMTKAQLINACPLPVD